KISLPVLRKDFITDPYQIYEARTIGADAVLLIAALLDKAKLREYNDIAASLGLDTLAEAHNERELDNILEAGCRTVGINNRDLTTFNVTLDTTEKLAGMIPKGYTIVSESGIKTNEDIRRVRACGADAVLIGETLMRSGDIAGCMQMLTK
ncbi:MAG: indole-3-glycerol-phosphate synthase, partial [Oscillospiraceae bacterium]|nr:indole-3-glycerol-phosphate synthase [Oscillospiraceae bacterium]